MNSTSILPTAFHSLVSLLETQFAHLRFPGIDGSVLQTLRQEVDDSEAAFRAAERSLEDARLTLKAKETVAIERAERALAFLRVCAADDPALAQALVGLSFAKGPAPLMEAAPKRRGRPRKAEGTLFSSVESTMESSDEADDRRLASEAVLSA